MASRANTIPNLKNTSTLAHSKKNSLRNEYPDAQNPRLLPHNVDNPRKCLNAFAGDEIPSTSESLRNGKSSNGRQYRSISPDVPRTKTPRLHALKKSCATTQLHKLAQSQFAASQSNAKSKSDDDETSQPKSQTQSNSSHANPHARPECNECATPKNASAKCSYLFSTSQRRSVTDLMPMIGARFYTQLEALQSQCDMQEDELSKEMENGRLYRILVKLNCINERPDLNLDCTWSETGDRYMLKLFRDYLFHSVTDDGRPWLDHAHIVQNLNKLDAGSLEKVQLMSRDEQSVLIVTYAELKNCLENSFAELTENAANPQ